MNGSIMKIAGEEALRQNIIKTKEYVQQHGGGGHTIITASSLPMAGQPNLQFEGVHVENVGQAGQGKTVIKPQFHVCATEAEWNQMTDAEKNDPLIYWVRPWASSDAFATDRTPVGTVVSVAGTYNYTTHTPTGRFPSKDYLVCNGAVTVDGKNVSKQTFPKLAEYFQEVYGNFQYFGTGAGGADDFSLPNWELDFPEDNGILCIKAQISSTAITFAEVDDTGIYAGEDKVPSCARVAEIEDTGVFVRRSGIVCTFDVSTSGWNTSNEVDVPQVNGLNVIGFTVYTRSSYRVYSVMPSYNSSTHKVQCGGYVSGTGTFTVILYPLYAK